MNKIKIELIYILLIFTSWLQLKFWPKIK